MTRIEQTYLEWLISQIFIPNNNKTYNDVFERLHDTEFVWTVPNDDNRVQDGLDLRNEFSKHEVMRGKGASVLEVLIALSRRVAFIADGDQPHIWAWRLFRNLRLHKLPDPLTQDKSDRLEEILEALIWRTYERDGQGGFFPLTDTLEDQTKVEIWDQMNSYIMETQDK